MTHAKQHNRQILLAKRPKGTPVPEDFSLVKTPVPEPSQGQMLQWLKAGDIKYREHLIDGLENTPSAFIGLLQGQNFGKLVVRVNDRN